MSRTRGLLLVITFVAVSCSGADNSVETTTTTSEEKVTSTAGVSGPSVLAVTQVSDATTTYDIRADETVHSGVSLSVSGMTGGDWRVEP